MNKILQSKIIQEQQGEKGVESVRTGIQIPKSCPDLLNRVRGENQLPGILALIALIIIFIQVCTILGEA